MKIEIEASALESIKAMCEHLQREREILLDAMTMIRMRATSDAQVEELEDCQRDLRHIFAMSQAAIAKCTQEQS